MPGITKTTSRSSSWTYWLLLLPFLGVLWVPSYNSVDPVLFSMPFFYWYQLLWIFISAGLTAIAYVVDPAK